MDILDRQQKACLRLFKGYLVDSENWVQLIEERQSFIKEALENGVVINGHVIPEIVKQYSIELYGKKPEQWNSTFHKSFSTVRDTPIEVLVVQQIFHYITTYGFESLGVYNQNTVYIPNEILQIPELEEGVTFNTVNQLSIEDLKNSIMVLLTSGIALSKETIEDIMLLSDFIDKDNFDSITNKEVKTMLFDKYDVVPKNNITFLRYLLYKTIGDTLLIKDKSTIQKIKELSEDKYKLVLDLFYKYINQYGYVPLSMIFNRYKQIFISFKRNDKRFKDNKEMDKIINRISKLSKKYHKPTYSQILDNLTSIQELSYLTQKEILEKLNEITIFKEVSIINCLNYILGDYDSRMYKIRNGKAWVKMGDYITNEGYPEVRKNIRDLVYNHLVNRLKPILKDKTIYIPDNINYTFPVSEKRFSGNIPEGSYIEVNRPQGALVIGVHWFNTNVNDGHHSDYYNGNRVDLHASNKDEQFGWNTSYRSNSNEFYYSGDVTNAPKPNGATELFYIGKDVIQKSFLLTLNKYCGGNGQDVPYDFIVAECDKSSIDYNYVINPNDVLLSIPGKFEYNKTLERYETTQKVVGLVKIYKDKIRLYFNDFSLGNSIVTRRSDVTKGAFDYLYNYTDVQLKLKDVLTDCGCNLCDSNKIDTMEEVELVNPETNEVEIFYKKVQKDVDYDLSLNNINKSTLIKLLTRGEK